MEARQNLEVFKSLVDALAWGSSEPFSSLGTLTTDESILGEPSKEIRPAPPGGQTKEQIALLTLHFPRKGQK